MFANVKIGSRLALGFGIVLVLLGAITVTGSMRLAELNGYVSQIVAQKYPATSTVEDLLIWSRHFDRPTLGKTLPTQLAAVAPLTGGKAGQLVRPFF